MGPRILTQPLLMVILASCKGHSERPTTRFVPTSTLVTSEEKSSMTRRCMDDSSNLHDELVWLHSPALPRGQSKKGPYQVLQRLTDCDYRIQVALGHIKY